MSPERSKNESTDVRQLIRSGLFTQLRSRGEYASSLEFLLDDKETLDKIWPYVERGIIKRGHDIDSVALIEAIVDDEEGESQMDDPPEGGSGGSKVPRVGHRPPDGHAGAEAELEFEPDADNDFESDPPHSSTIEPEHKVPSVPVGFIVESQ